MGGSVERLGSGGSHPSRWAMPGGDIAANESDDRKCNGCHPRRLVHRRIIRPIYDRTSHPLSPEGVKGGRGDGGTRRRGDGARGDRAKAWTAGRASYALADMLWLIAAGSENDDGPEPGLFWYIALRIFKALFSDPMSVLPAFGILLASAALIWSGVVMY